MARSALCRHVAHNGCRRTWATLRVVGHTVGPVRLVNAAGVRSEQAVRFAAFRPADSSLPAPSLIGGEQFHCRTCGGSVIVNQLARFSTYADVVEDVEAPPRRGRATTPWRSSQVSPTSMKQPGIGVRPQLAMSPARVPQDPQGFNSTARKMLTLARRSRRPSIVIDACRWRTTWPWAANTFGWT